MRLLQCHIENFGKWSDKTFHFSQEISSFCEENGWGKSTLAAFIRIMFFGFANERKRDVLENERKKYMPWQGGVYGGQIVFEASGTLYAVSRTFGKKEKEDVFELRYLDTNKKSNDFSENLGEELFHIDQTSFLRTIFLSQNDCETAMTDGMSAKIGNLELQKDDMSNYEQANERLLDVLNKMSPTRKTGSLYKMSEMIGGLSMRVRQKSVIDQSLDKLFSHREEEKEKLQVLELEKVQWLETQKNRNAQNELVMKMKEYNGYCQNYKHRMEYYQRVRSYFPVSLPHNSELEGYVRSGSRLLEENRSVQIYQLTMQEEKLLEKYKKQNWENPRKSPKKGLHAGVFWGLGLVLLLVGVVCFFAKKDFGLFLLLVGICLNGIGIFLQINSRFEGDLGKKSEYLEQRKLQAEVFGMELERYQQLQEKERLYESACHKSLAMSKEISSYIKSLGFAPAENLQEQLQEIKEHFLECKNAYQEYKAAKKRKEDFEENCGQIDEILKMSDSFMENSEVEIVNSNIQVGECSLGILSETHDEKLQRLLGEIDLCKEEVSKIDVQLEELLEQKDSILESEQELEKQQELYREGMKKYEDLKRVQEYLQRARESFTAKYSGPIKTGFDKYYHMLTGQKALEYKLDVNSNLTAVFYGMQRDSRLLSQGYQDLLGLCMRMAFVDSMYQDEKPFLILDDPFVNLDEEKTSKGLELLEKIGQEYQIIYFTCHKSRDIG